MKPLISIVSGTHNRFDLLRGMMQSVRQQIPVGIPYEFVIVDAGSTDGTLEWLREQPNTLLIEDGTRTGAIDAFTRGAYAAQSKYVVLANDDIKFWDGSIIKALLHLENQPRCGAVAFADDRPSPGKRGHAVMQIGGTINGRFRPVNYAQVGMFRKWLGDQLQWWFADGRMKAARSYGGDSGLSACIWESGYTVDAVDSVAIDDYMPDDDLRQTEMNPNGRADGALFASQWPQGALVADKPIIDNPDREQLRVLYLPIFEAGHAQQKLQKRGLREALARRGYIVWEIDYLNIPDMKQTLLDTLREFQPHLMLTQIHGHEPLTADILSEIRAHHPRMVIVNWNGDYWPHGLTSPEMLRLLRHVHLQTTINADVLRVYEEHNIAAAYWQIGYEEPLGDLPKVSAHEVVWLANRHSNRLPLYEFLRSLPVDVGVYGSGWPQAEGNCLYDFTTGAALYRNAKIAIGDNQFPDTVGFVSNRIFQALAAGGALLLHQRVKGLEELTGLCNGAHYVEWTDTDDLAIKIAYYSDPANEKERKRIARLGTAFVREQHSFDRRVKELFEALLPEARQHIGNTVKVIYRGQLAQVGVRGKRTNKQYTFDRDVPLPVDRLDAPYILQDTKNWVELQMQEGALA